MAQSTATRTTKGRVLFLYPNMEGYGGIPNGIALLSGMLKNAGYETDCFDTTFLNSPPETHLYRKRHGGVMDADHEKFWGVWKPEYKDKIPQLLLEKIDNFKPDLLAVSLVDVSYNFAMNLLHFVRKNIHIPTLAGGITVTLCPDMIIQNECIDAVCVGEGEQAIVEFTDAVMQGTDRTSIRNLWVKHDGRIIKNELRPFMDLDQMAFQDWSIFDERHYYKPYMGTFRRTAFVEMARGCHYNCSFCCTANLRKIFSGLGPFVRQRSPDQVLAEAAHLKDLYGLELIFFTDDNFLGMKPERFQYFCDLYKEKVGLPFYIQTRPETVKEEYIAKLKEIGISTIAVGVEHGDEELRRKTMNRRMGNDEIKKAFAIIHKHGIRSTANLIIGMPGEKESMFKATINLLREIEPKSVSINYFQPYQGTQLREESIKEGYIPANHILNVSNDCLDMPQFPRERLKHLYTNFSKYLSGEFEIESLSDEL